MEVTCPKLQRSTPLAAAIVPKPGWSIPARCARNSAKPPKALFLTQGYVYDSAEQCEARFKGEDPGYHLFALFQSDDRDVRAPHDRARRRRSRPLHRDRHGRGDDRDAGAAESRRSCGRGESDVRIVPLCGGRSAAALRHRSRRWSTASISTSGRRRCGRTPKAASWKARPIRRSTCSTFGAIAEIAHQAGARLIVDNVFATPIWQSPLALGADVVVYSATKHIDGQGRCLGGIILSSEAFIAEHIHTFMRQTGPSMSPFNAWVLLKGLETLAIRVRAQTETAARDRRCAGDRIRKSRG